jgi:hypothetical protein
MFGMNFHSPLGLMACFRRASSAMRLRRSIDAGVRRHFTSASALRDCGESHVRLGDGEVWAFDPNGASVTVRVMRGNAWITQAGSPRDAVIGAGETFESAQFGKIVVQALDNCVIEVAKESADVKIL